MRLDLLQIDVQLLHLGGEVLIGFLDGGELVRRGVARAAPTVSGVALETPIASPTALTAIPASGPPRAVAMLGATEPTSERQSKLMITLPA